MQDERLVIPPELGASSALSPIAQLLSHLPHLAGVTNQIDFAASDPSMLVAVADAAESTALRSHQGLQALGGLLRCLDDEASQQRAATIMPGLGGLITELGALAACCTELAAQCRQQTFDYSPQNALGEPITG